MDYTNKLIALFRAHRNEAQIGPMAAYLKYKFEMLGIKKPERETYLKSFIASEGWPESTILSQVVEALWQQPEREFHYLALKFLDRHKTKLTFNDLPMLEKLITTNSWWDTVDGLAANQVGEVFKNFPEYIPDWTTKWMKSDNMWLQRTCLLFQLKYKTNTNLELLESFIASLNTSKEFFIQKAIGWILREYSKTDAKYVLGYVQTNPLMPLSRREALKVIERNGLV